MDNVTASIIARQLTISNLLKVKELREISTNDRVIEEIFNIIMKDLEDA